MLLRNLIFRFGIRPQILPAVNRICTPVRLYSTKKSNLGTDFDSPVKYTASAASKWRAEITRRGAPNDRLWYEPYVILASISVFMIYFTLIREENDVDLELNRTLYSRIEGLEEYQLRASLEYNKARGSDTSAIRKRLAELEEMKMQNKNQDEDD